ncbi:MAG: AbrB/MazE/SpoVT family DNA-binding domain-containing protein [Fibrobacteres bacterium]|jgi:antitoxin PrlF|nr:AbrB/MazE/SpoVT family DNA-binding domain-containing protein [Fibrobacterota bacterium]
MVATLTSKGQITLPVGLRRKMGLKAGDKLDFKLTERGEVVFEVVKSGLEGLAGIAKPKDGRRRTLAEMEAAIAKGRSR